MTMEEENQHLREQVAQRDERIQHLEAALEEQSRLMQQMQTHIGSLMQQVQALQERQAKDSHNSGLPPSSDRSRASRKVCGRKARRNREGKRDTKGRA